LRRSCALLTAQVSSVTLPDEVLVSILRRAWADRPPRPAAEEVRAAAGLASMCRRVRALLRTPPLPLALDFSAECLSSAQHHWLLGPMQAGRLEAASFHIEDALWQQPLLESFLSRHGRTLLRLSGVPLRLVATLSEEERPALDLGGLRVTTLGIDCRGRRSLMPVAEPICRLLWPECLPGALEELELVGLYGLGLEELAWAPHVGAGAAGLLPWLQTLRVETAEEGAPLETDIIPLFDGLPGLPGFEIHEMHDYPNLDMGLFERVRDLRIVAAGRCGLLFDLAIAELTLHVDRICNAGLQAVELCGEEGIVLKQLGASHDDGDSIVTCEVVHDMISRYGDRFAVDVGGPEPPNKGSCDKSVICRLAWRRWPAPGAPGLQAAKAAHEHARAWAAEAAHEQ